MFCSRKMNRKINYIHERALRLVYDDYTTSFANLLTRDESVCIHHRNIHKVAIEMFIKVKHNLCPEVVQSLFCQTICTKSKASFQRPHVKTVYKGEQSLRWFGPTVWDNMIPKKIKVLSNLEEFKKAIDVWVPSNCPCRLCKDYVPNLGFGTLFE